MSGLSPTATSGYSQRGIAYGLRLTRTCASNPPASKRAPASTSTTASARLASRRGLIRCQASQKICGIGLCSRRKRDQLHGLCTRPVEVWCGLSNCGGTKWAEAASASVHRRRRQRRQGACDGVARWSRRGLRRYGVGGVVDTACGCRDCAAVWPGYGPDETLQCRRFYDPGRWLQDGE